MLMNDLNYSMDEALEKIEKISADPNSAANQQPIQIAKSTLTNAYSNIQTLATFSNFIPDQITNESIQSITSLYRPTRGNAQPLFKHAPQPLPASGELRKLA